VCLSKEIIAIKDDINILKTESIELKNNNNKLYEDLNEQKTLSNDKINDNKNDMINIKNN
jgi:uncharacterized protein YoxC